MLEERWYRLLHYLRKDLVDVGQGGAELEGDEATLSLRIRIPETTQWWDCRVQEDAVLHGDLRLETDFLLAEYRIACTKTTAGLASATRS